MEAVIGLILGYLVGCRSKPIDFDAIRQSWDKIKNSEEALSMMRGTAKNGLQMFLLGGSAEPLDSDEIRQAWNKIKKSKEAQNLVAGTADKALWIYRLVLRVLLGQIISQR